jgi:hypothetical protein
MLPNKLNYTFVFRKPFYFVAFGLKIIGHQNPDNNLESLCILVSQIYIYRSPEKRIIENKRAVRMCEEVYMTCTLHRSL